MDQIKEELGEVGMSVSESQPGQVLLEAGLWSSPFTLSSTVTTDSSLFLMKYIIGSRLRHRFADGLLESKYLYGSPLLFTS